MSWSAVEGAEFYVALLFDSDLSGAWLSVVGVRGLSYTWESQYVGHRHVVAVQAWNSIGGGLPTLGRSVMPGTEGTLAAPTSLSVNSVDATTAVSLRAPDRGSDNTNPLSSNSPGAAIAKTLHTNFTSVLLIRIRQSSVSGLEATLAQLQQTQILVTLVLHTWSLVFGTTSSLSLLSMAT